MARLILGDCLAALRDLPDDSVDGVVTDPPYGMGKDYGNSSDKEANALALVEAVMPELFRVMRLGAMAFVFGSPRLIHRTMAAGEAGGLRPHRLLWLYKPNDCTYPWRGWLLKSEATAVFSKGKPDRWTGDEYCHDTYVFNHRGGELPKGTKHPSVKPLAVVRDLVKKCTGPLILDPFMGSGTTGVACALEGREFIGMELNPEYFELASSRIEAAFAA